MSDWTLRAKLDENLGSRGAEILTAGGWDVTTVLSEKICGTPDPELIALCTAERRVLVTLDQGFSNVLVFPPHGFRGIVVLRLPEPLAASDIERAIGMVAKLASQRDPAGRLWIVDRFRIREFEGIEEDLDD